MVLKICWIIMLMGVVPMILGLPWTKALNPKHKYCFAYSAGFFMALALYQIVCVPIVLCQGSFRTIVFVYSILVIISCLFCLYYSLKNKLFMQHKSIRLDWIEIIYLVFFLFILSVQIIRGFTYDLTYMSADDAVYTAMSSDAYIDNGLMTVDSYTGVGITIDTKYALAQWNTYPAFFATISQISVVTIVHTVQYVQLIILAYATYWYIAGELITKRDNQLIFMVIIGLFYWFGYHSHYSLSFRLLGPNYQGKAVLAVSLTPMILTVLMRKSQESYSSISGLLFLLLSITGVSFTLWGAGTILVIIIIPLLLSLCSKGRNWKNVLYIPWGCTVPLLSIGYFLLYKYAV